MVLPLFGMRFGDRFLSVGLCVYMVFSLSGLAFFAFALTAAFYGVLQLWKGRSCPPPLPVVGSVWPPGPSMDKPPHPWHSASMPLPEPFSSLKQARSRPGFSRPCPPVPSSGSTQPPSACWCCAAFACSCLLSRPPALAGVHSTPSATTARPALAPACCGPVQFRSNELPLKFAARPGRPSFFYGTSILSLHGRMTVA